MINFFILKFNSIHSQRVLQVGEYVQEDVCDASTFSIYWNAPIPPRNIGHKKPIGQVSDPIL